jgi:hypothetical protein
LPGVPGICNSPGFWWQASFQKAVDHWERIVSRERRAFSSHW